MLITIAEDNYLKEFTTSECSLCGLPVGRDEVVYWLCGALLNELLHVACAEAIAEDMTGWLAEGRRTEEQA